MSDEKKSKLLMSSAEDTQGIQDEYNADLIKNSGVNKQMLDLIKNATETVRKTKASPRLAFTEDPQTTNSHAGIFKLKANGLLPDGVIKQIRVQNLLVAAILRARGNTLSMMGHIRKDRFDIGLELEIKPEYKAFIKTEEMPKIQERMDKFLKILVNCGYTDGLPEDKKLTLPEYFDISTRNGLSFGKFATEIIYRDDDQNEFHRFRPVDAGTINPAVRNGESANSVRQASIKWLEETTGIKIDKDLLEKDKYSWVQVIQGTPRQAFTSKEMVVYNLYPSSDVEHNGFPVTPLDTIANSVTTHMSIEIYNKLYFQNGRAARGMLVIKSEEIDQTQIEAIKQQFNASINNVTNSFRTPIFGVGVNDDVSWVSTVPQKKDGEFQYLYDQVTRNILSAFNMSPDELPGFTHLSKGTNQASLSESSSEYKLTAARDTGIRPLILKFQDFLNERMFPIIDPELSQLCVINLSGFDAETKEQESRRLQQDMPIHYDYDQIMEEVNKTEVGSHMGGNIPFNEAYRLVLDQYGEVGKITAHFNDSPAASIDPILRYKRDQFFFQQMQQLAQFNPEAVQAYYSSRSNAMQTLKFLIQDYLDDLDDVGN